ncbi:MAG: zinc-dependent metalloprotease [Verrucomicrobia bacterium]|nr:zinc-dependent metalloprotease [Verrucomicrobiota bacterium]
MLPPRPPSKFRDFAEVTKDTIKYDGFFTLYRTNEILYAEIKPMQLNQPMIAPMAIARGLESAGTPLNFGDEWILVFRRVDDKIQVLRRNIHYQAPRGTPLEKAVQQNYTDSVLMALPIVSINMATQGALIDFGQIFLADFADLRIGMLDRNRSSWSKIKVFPNNVELQVEATFTGRGLFFGYGDGGVVDPRGITLVIHYSLARLPDAAYKTRVADQRVGFFLNATKDFGSNDPDTTFVRYVNRWRLEKADPKAKLSPPKKQVVWWVENTVPHEYRPFVEDGILEWNKAFEKIGFRNALAVRWQQDGEEFEPEDINYCTFRWITTSSTFAMSGLRSNPLTGEMIDGDVIFDASWIRYWKREYAFFAGTPVPAAEGLLEPLAVAEVISPMMAAKHGYGLPFPLPHRQWSLNSRTELNGQPVPQLYPSDLSPLQMQLSRRLGPGKLANCQFATGKRFEFAMAAMALADQGKVEPGGKLPEEFLGQAIKEVVMHEVGHSLGLRHNFKASSMLNNDQINDTSITRTKGMTGSVMDYNPINIAPKGQKQGDYATTTIGPYDYWAIEYAYRPVEGNEADELKKIAARSPDPDLTFATDEDLWMSDDPLVNTYDLGSDPLRYGQDRMAVASDLLKNLDEKVVKDGESWARLRSAFSVLLGQFGNAAYIAASYVGGQSFSRDFKGGEKSRDPIVPIAGSRQREALKLLVDKILTDQAFKFSPSLLRRLTTEHWYHWGSDSFSFGGGITYPIYDRILALQRIVLSQCFDGGVLSRIMNQELQADEGANPIKVSEIFRAITDGVWSELATGSDAKDVSLSTVRRNLQREHLRRLANMVLGSRRSPLEDLYGYVIILGGSSSVPADAKSLARMHLREIGDRIDKKLSLADLKIDDTSRAHLIECRQRIAKVLESSYTANEP